MSLVRTHFCVVVARATVRGVCKVSASWRRDEEKARLAEEDGLELQHAGDGEQHGGVLRNERGARQDSVAPGSEESLRAKRQRPAEEGCRASTLTRKRRRMASPDSSPVLASTVTPAARPHRLRARECASSALLSPACLSSVLWCKVRGEEMESKRSTSEVRPAAPLELRGRARAGRRVAAAPERPKTRWSASGAASGAG